MEQTFEQIIKECHKDRVNKEYWQTKSLDNLAKQEFAKFCCWCRAFKGGECTEQNFKEYQKQEKPNIDFWIKKRIAELFFSYKFEFDYKTMKWKRLKGENNG